MNKTAQEIDLNYIVDMVEKHSSNDWDDLCDNCSSLIKDAGMTYEEIDEIVTKCKKV